MKFSKTMAVTSAALLALSLSACSDGESDATAEGGLDEITVGIIPIAAYAAIPYGIDHGIFEEHGLDVTAQPSSGGAEMLPALQTGDMDVVIGNVSNLLLAVDQGLDMRVVSGYQQSLPEGHDVNGVVVRADSGIESWVDLEGAEVAVNALRGQGDLTIMESVAEDGGDPAEVNFVELNFPDMESQLERGNVDAVWVPEPFMHNALESDDYELLGHPNQVVAGMPTVVSFVTGELAHEDPDLIERYQAALDEVLTAFASDEEGAMEAVMEFMDLPQEEAEIASELTSHDAAIPDDQIEQLAELMVKYEFVEENPISEGFFVE
jgi:NitT/TauT family transport system substrate-binding protein